MKKTPANRIITVAGIVIILLAVLSRRFYLKSYNEDSFLSFLAGFAVILVGFLIFRVILKSKTKK